MSSSSATRTVLSTLPSTQPSTRSTHSSRYRSSSPTHRTKITKSAPTSSRQTQSGKTGTRRTTTSDKPTKRVKPSKLSHEQRTKYWKAPSTAPTNMSAFNCSIAEAAGWDDVFAGTTRASLTDLKKSHRQSKHEPESVLSRLENTDRATDISFVRSKTPRQVYTAFSEYLNKRLTTCLDTRPTIGSKPTVGDGSTTQHVSRPMGSWGSFQPPTLISVAA